MFSVDDLPFFFEQRHRELAAWLRDLIPGLEPEHDGRTLARRMGEVGLYSYLVPDGAMDVRALCLIREALGYHNPTADSIFAVQGLGSHPIWMTGTEEQRQQLHAIREGSQIGAFGLTEPEAGSDVAALQTLATRTTTGWRLQGEKTLISNIGINQHVVIFANADPSAGRKGISAFLLPMSTPGVEIVPVPMTVEHPIGGLRLDCEVPADALLGRTGDGLRLALGTLGTFRVTVGAAALGMGRRALDEAISRSKQRRQFGGPLSEKPVVQEALAEMATDLEAARLLVWRAAWEKDRGGRAIREVAMAKLYATEAAFRVIDRAVQLHGGLGVTLGTVVERLYREIRPLRIYEGTSEIQKLIIGEDLVR